MKMVQSLFVAGAFCVFVAGCLQTQRITASAHTPQTSAVPASIPLSSPEDTPPLDAVPQPLATTVPSQTNTASAESCDGGTGRDALEVLSTLVVEAEQRNGYDRSDWSHWRQTPGGCSARERVLIEESTITAGIDPLNCSLSSGLWFSVYDNTWTNDASSFDVDHVVALAEAHHSGGWAWDAQKRAAFANDLSDPRSLRAVSAASNRSKSADDPSDWSPPTPGFLCQYVADHIAIKARWELSIDADEARALLDHVIDDCAGLVIDAWTPAPKTPDEAVLSPLQ